MGRLAKLKALRRPRVCIQQASVVRARRRQEVCELLRDVAPHGRRVALEEVCDLVGQLHLRERARAALEDAHAVHEVLVRLRTHGAAEPAAGEAGEARGGRGA